MAGILDITALLGTGITTIGFIQSNLPTQANDGNSVVRVAVGINAGLDASEGIAPKVFAFNEETDFIGQFFTDDSDNDLIIQAGSYKALPIDQSAGSGQQPTYLQFTATGDAICIAYIS